jgi:hypothetical protein
LHINNQIERNYNMAENQLESDQSGEQELPTPSFSDQATSSTSTGADEIVSKLLPQLEQMIERKVQSQKDKRISEIEKVLGGRSKILAELEEAGVPITKEVRAEMRIRELEERLNQPEGQPTPASVDGSTQQRVAVTEAIAKLTEYGLSSNDPGFIELLRGKYANRDAFDKAVLGHVVGKLAPQKPANPADVVQAPATAAASVNGDTAAKLARLNELQKQPTKNREEIKKLAEELDKAGWK